LRRKSWLVAGAGAAALVLIGAGVVMAQTPAPGSSNGTTFLDRVAQKLGIDTPKLKDAVKSAGSDQLDEAVQNGNLTQKQADNLKNKLNSRVDNGDGGFGLRPGIGRGFPGGKHGFGFGLSATGDQLAQFLGITTDQLATELRADGATLATVAQAHGKSRDDLKSFITGAAKSKTDDAVQSGDLTQKQADAVNAQMSQHIDQLIDGTFGLRGFRGPKGFPFLGPDGNRLPVPNGSPQPQQGSGTGISSS